MAPKKITKTTKSVGNPAKNSTKTSVTKLTAKRKVTPPAKSMPPAKELAVAKGSSADLDQEPAHGRVGDASDVARDNRLRKDLDDESGRSPSDRHRERLTAVEAEEDGVRDEDDDSDQAADKRKEAILEQEADDDPT